MRRSPESRRLSFSAWSLSGMLSIVSAESAPERACGISVWQEVFCSALWKAPGRRMRMVFSLKTPGSLSFRGTILALHLAEQQGKPGENRE